jgi:cytoskeleton protein RodZ
MSDQIEEAAAARGEPARMPLGAVLSAAREQRHWSIEDVSNHLRLSPRQIMALESDDFSSLPEPMITRGYIRNYARLLEINAEPLIEAYRAYAPNVYAHSLAMHSANILISSKRRRSWPVYLVGLLLAVILIGLWLFYTQYVPRQVAQQEDAVQQQVDQSTFAAPAPGDVAPVEVQPLPQPQSNEAPVAADSPDVVGTAPQAAESTATEMPVPAEPAAAGAATLKFSVSGDSWISVRDASGEEIFNKIKRAGNEDEVQGQPPFQVVIGNAEVSRLYYNGQQVDLAPHTHSNVARLTLE